MKMSLAQALKEKNRISGEMTRCWQMVAKENSKREDECRIVDVAKTYERIQLLRDKLVELKTKIGLANGGILTTMYKMDEAKNELTKLDKVNTNATSDYERLSYSETKELKRTAIFSATQIYEMREQQQQLCNELQDALDAYNARTTIDFESPLRKK